MSAFDRLLDQVDGFIRKFYKNQMIKGIFLFVGVLLLTYLVIITLEYFGRFNSYVRGSLFFGFLAVNGFILGKYIVQPLLKLKSFGKRINRYQASSIIGSFFPDISDRLLNTLQLKDQMDENSADFELLNASVQQRSANLSMVPFSNAIDLDENKKHLKWALPIVALFFGLLLFIPGMFKDGTERVVQFSKEFKIPPPFEFSFSNDNNSIEEGENFPFEVLLLGDRIPDKVYIRSSNGRALLKRTAKNKFVGELNQLRESTNMSFEANVDGELVRSDEFKVSVISKTAIGKMQATLVYPPYLGLENEVVENASDLTVPEGTRVSWSVVTKHSENTEFWLNDTKKSFSKDGFVVSEVFKNDAKGQVILKNKVNGNVDTTDFLVEVDKDNFPSIQVGEVKDSIKDGIRYFSGAVTDDHGLSSLNFVYTITSKNGAKRTERMNAGRVVGTESPFDFAVDFRREEIQLEDKITYYFVVTDNDGVNGNKATSSRTFVYKLPNLEELNEQRDEQQDKAKEDLADMMKQAEDFRKNLERLRKETLNSNKSNWNKQNQIQQLQEQQKSMIERLQEMQNGMENSLEEKEQLSEMDKELMEQQKQLEELMEELMDDELREMLKELEELMKEQDKEGVEEKLDELEMSAEDMKRQMERQMEMLKRLQVNEKIDAIEEELKELAKEQEELKEDIEEKGKASEEDKKEQDEINEKFDDLQKDIEKMDSLNKELKSPMDLGDPTEKGDEIEEELGEAKESLDKGKEGKAGESQEGAAEKMEDMAEQLQEMQSQASQEKQQEDMDMLRNILESLMALSFNQEDVMRQLSRVDDADPAFRKYSREQRKIVDDTKVVRDSLYALAERQPKIASFVDAELNKISANHDLSLEDIDERRMSDLGIHQQYTMTSYNNLALMLNESLQQMQMQMQNSKPGSGSCNKPGGKGQPKPGNGMSNQDMKQMLKKQLDQMKKGQGKGGKKPGQKPGEGKNPGGQKLGGKDGQGGMGLGNKEIAKMAAEQSAIRKRLEQLRRELNKGGKGEGNKLSPLIKELEEQERDLVNKRLSNNMVKRQQDILTRLLESEKATRERGLDEKRESKSGKNENNGNLIRFDQYNKEKLKQIELLRSVDPAYRKYYKDRANEYFNRML
ncbi:MAG: hypothetical protein P8P74_03200 [Crocinitomicaceae bacterium]|nr:hypothetical protein [Crocinitomicaceae bacterium]